MDTNTTYALNSGTIKLYTYNREDAFSKNKRIRCVVGDIYHKLDDFSETVKWIFDIIPFEGKTIADVLGEYVEKFGEDSFIMFQAGSLHSVPIEVSAVVSTIGYALKVGFCHILFNRCMPSSYSVPDLCVYENAKVKSWIGDNIGDGKIIKSVVHPDNNDD